MKYLIAALLGLFLCVGALADVIRIDSDPIMYYGLSSDTKPLNNKFATRFCEINTGKCWAWSKSGTGVLADWLEWYPPGSDAGRRAGERNITSTTGHDYTAVMGEFRVKNVAYNGTLSARTICSGPCIIAGYEVTTALSAHASDINNNGASYYPIAASKAVGIYMFPGPVIFDTNAIWNPGSLAAGQIIFYYHPVDAGKITWAP